MPRLLLRTFRRVRKPLYVHEASIFRGRDRFEIRFWPSMSSAQNDEVYRSALEENAEALVKKRDRLRRIREKIAALTGGLPTCTNTGRPSSGLSPGDSECGPAVTEDSYRSSANRIPSTHGASEGSQRPDQSATTPRHSASTDSRGAGVQLLLGADADTETRDEPEGKREVSFSLSQERRSEERSRSHTEHDGSIFL